MILNHSEPERRFVPKKTCQPHTSLGKSASFICSTENWPASFVPVQTGQLHSAQGKADSCCTAAQLCSLEFVTFFIFSVVFILFALQRWLMVEISCYHCSFSHTSSRLHRGQSRGVSDLRVSFGCIFFTFFRQQAYPVSSFQFCFPYSWVCFVSPRRTSALTFTGSSTQEMMKNWRSSEIAGFESLKFREV